MSSSLLIPPRSSSPNYCSCGPSHSDTCTPIDKTDNKRGIDSPRATQTNNTPGRTPEGSCYSRAPESSKYLSDSTTPPPGLAQLPLLQSPYYGATESDSSACASGSREKRPYSNKCPEDHREAKHEAKHKDQLLLLKQATAPPNYTSSSCSPYSPAPAPMLTPARTRLAAIAEAAGAGRGCNLSSHTASAPLANEKRDCSAAAPTVGGCTEIANGKANATPTRERPRLWSGVVKQWAQQAQSPPQKQQSAQYEYRPASGVRASDLSATQAVAAGACRATAASHPGLDSQSCSSVSPTVSTTSASASASTTLSTSSATATSAMSVETPKPSRECDQAAALTAACEATLGGAGSVGPTRATAPATQEQVQVREWWQVITPSRFFKLNPLATEFVPAALRTRSTAQPRPDNDTNGHTTHSICCDSGSDSNSGVGAQRQTATLTPTHVTQKENHETYGKPEQDHQIDVKAVASAAASASEAAAELTPVVDTHETQNKNMKYQKWSEIVASPALPVYSAHRFRAHERPTNAIQPDVTSRGWTNRNEAQVTRTMCASIATGASPYLPQPLQIPLRIPSRSSSDNANTASTSTCHTIPHLQHTFAAQQTPLKSTLPQPQKRYEMATASVATQTEDFEDFAYACANGGATSSLSSTCAARPTNADTPPTNSRRRQRSWQKRNRGGGGSNNEEQPRRWIQVLTPIEEPELKRGEQDEANGHATRASAGAVNHFATAATSPCTLRALRARAKFESEGEPGLRQRMPLVVITPPADDHYENYENDRNEEKERSARSGCKSSYTATPQSTASSEETPEFCIRVSGAFWAYLRSRDSELEADADAGEKCDQKCDRKREIRGSSCAPPIDLEAPPRAASPAESMVSASSESSSGLSSGCSNESSTCSCFAGEPSTAAAESTVASTAAPAEVVQRPPEERLEEHWRGKKTATQGPTEKCVREADKVQVSGCGHLADLNVDQDAT